MQKIHDEILVLEPNESSETKEVWMTPFVFRKQDNGLTIIKARRVGWLNDPSAATPEEKGSERE